MYKLNYGTVGKVCSIQKGNMSIPIADTNMDYQEFLKWNNAQPKPLDLNSTIEPVKPQPVRDLAKEIDDLAAKVAEMEKKVILK